MRKKGISMLQIDNQVIIAIIGALVSLLTGLGVTITKLLDYRKQIKEFQIQAKRLDIDDEKLDIDKVNANISAAAKLAEILTTVVDPLQTRITNLERESTERLSQINQLNTTLFLLQRTLQEKDLELDRLKYDYNKQTLIVSDQAVKIEAQERRIFELEQELKKFKEKSNNDGQSCV